MAQKNKGLHWTKAENPRLRHLASLQQSRYPDNVEEGYIVTEFNDTPQIIRLRQITWGTKAIFRQGSCTLLAYALHEITGLPLIMIDSSYIGRINVWEGHAAVQVEKDVFLDIGGILPKDEMLKQFREHYRVSLKNEAYVTKPKSFIKKTMGFLGQVHPSMEATELEWLIVEDFAKHLIQERLIPYYEKHHPELVADMQNRLAAKESTESLFEERPILEESLRIYSRSAGVPWQHSPNTRLQELVKAVKDEEYEDADLTKKEIRIYKKNDPGKIPVRFRYRTELMLGRIDEKAVRVMKYEANLILALALHDLTGLPLAGVTEKHENKTYIRNSGIETSDGMFLDIFGLTSQKDAKPFLGIGPKPWKTFDRDEFIALVVGGNATPEFPLNRIGELEWLVVQEFAKTLIQSVLIPHCQKTAPELIDGLRQSLQRTSVSV